MDSELLLFSCTQIDNSIKQLQVMSLSCFFIAFEILFPICQKIANLLTKKVTPTFQRQKDDKLLSKTIKHTAPLPHSLRLAEFQLLDEL